MIVLSNDDVARLLPMHEAIGAVTRAMITVSSGGAEMPLRSVMPVGGDNRMGIMPGALSDPACFGIKLISLFPGNAALGLSSHRGAYLLFEPATGAPVAMMDASLLTAIRTAAASGVATRALARTDATRLAIIGYGEQAEHHLEAICAVRPVTHVHVAGRDPYKAAAFCAAARKNHPDVAFQSGSDIRAAVARADIICTVTAAPQPILEHLWLPRGCHVNVVGSSVPTMREVDDDLVLHCSIWVDYLPSALAQAGEIVDLIAAGRFTEGQLKGEIGMVLKAELQGRITADEQTAYRSLGVAAQDLAVAHLIADKAAKTGAGQKVAF
ncbi:ornithine cyclodeaminase family protein [Sedimentitalea nanhaiensis]|uniref:Ornithine cyclodeaminase n=1 Tax=Sedimentitalea nanhaiensis TaxID=999627 RepID=A0A1I7C4Z3_9RHOB|nr:ornithine cyclodeaminase family protein [Sedimentitalea nanhaiensis]SFT94495.1 ornithine cyclodeaminase [Sedimentitalea nanhaiensis]